ncbi:LSU ribosomal protein L9p [hydrothermal vent metagenome]|uniref:LSU ribosomal protein L9p n=1 Tax=hydrothermal vent metagenome TaxID=652676 RepID=A0A1W1CJT1_9ZZZZ
MQVILLENIKKLGALGDSVNVKAGFARNFLIPQKKAQIATKENLAAFEKIRADLEKKSEKLKAEAIDKKDKIEGLKCVIKANVGEEGKLFGSIGTSDISNTLEKLGHKIAKRDINMPDGVIRFAGEYDIEISLYLDISATIKVVVENEEQ